MTDEIKLTKSVAEVYLFEGLPACRWAKFTVQDMGTKGRISIASDFGDWQNGWGSCGVPFKQFLAQLNIEYAADKFGADRWFDADGTTRQFRVDIIERRKSQGYDTSAKKEARHLWDGLKWLSDAITETQFCTALEGDCPDLIRMYDGMPPRYHDIHPSFRRFWKEAWAIFIETIQQEYE